MSIIREPRRQIIPLVFLLLAVSLAGCTSINQKEHFGELALFIADSPGNLYEIKEVNVAIAKVTVHSQEKGWKLIHTFEETEDGYKTFDLRSLIFDEELLGQEMLPEGSYTKIRLYLADEDLNDLKSHVLFQDGTIENLYSPGAIEAGLQIDYAFTIEKGVLTRLLLDFDVLEILNDRGQNGFRLRRTAIKVIDIIVAGDIEGQVLNQDLEPILAYDVLVEALNSHGERGALTVATTEKQNGRPAGSFRLRGLNEDLYTVTAYIKDESGHILYETDDPLTQVEVTADTITLLDHPIILPTKSQDP